LKQERMTCLKSGFKYANKQENLKNNCFLYNLWFLSRQRFNHTWNPYFARILYFLRRSIITCVFFFLWISSLVPRPTCVFHYLIYNFGFFNFIIWICWYFIIIIFNDFFSNVIFYYLNSWRLTITIFFLFFAINVFFLNILTALYHHFFLCFLKKEVGAEQNTGKLYIITNNS